MNYFVESMEFSIDGGSYVKYDGIIAPDLTGAHTVLVRIAADTATGTPTGAETTLTFTVDPTTPTAPTTPTDRSNDEI